MEIKLANGSSMEIEQGLNAYDVAKLISEDLARNAICAKINGELVDTSAILKQGDELRIITLKDEGYIKYRTFTHTKHPFNIKFKYYTLNLNSTTSPSATTYSLPSERTRPFSFAAAMEPFAFKSSKAMTSARIKPRSKSVWILPAA